jgi:hypothetical protein
MFRAMFLPIIRSTWLYLQYLVVFTQVATGWCRWWVGTELCGLWGVYIYTELCGLWGVYIYTELCGLWGDNKYLVTWCSWIRASWKQPTRCNYIGSCTIPSRLYVFRAMFSPIIRHTWLYLQLLVVFTLFSFNSSMTPAGSNSCE